MNNEEHWLLDAIKDIEIYAQENNLPGLVEGVSSVLEIYAAEAVTDPQLTEAIRQRLRP